jgi:hypothetical protein
LNTTWSPNEGKIIYAVNCYDTLTTELWCNLYEIDPYTLDQSLFYRMDGGGLLYFELTKGGNNLLAIFEFKYGMKHRIIQLDNQGNMDLFYVWISTNKRNIKQKN